MTVLVILCFFTALQKLDLVVAVTAAGVISKLGSPVGARVESNENEINGQLR